MKNNLCSGDSAERRKQFFHRRSAKPPLQLTKALASLLIAVANVAASYAATTINDQPGITINAAGAAAVSGASAVSTLSSTDP